MTDRAPGTVVIYAATSDQAEKVLPILSEYGFQTPFNVSDDQADAIAGFERLALFEQYVDAEAALSMPSDIGDQLIEIGVAFAAWTDAKYEWDGSIRLHVPGLPTFEGSCMQDGTVVVEETQIDRAIIESLPGPDYAERWTKLAAELDRLTGRRVRDAIEELRLQNGGTE